MNGWKFDPAIERLRARVRFGIVAAALAVLAGSALTNLDRQMIQPLLAALSAVAHPR